MVAPLIPMLVGSNPNFKEGVRSIVQPGINTIKDMYGKGQDARGYITGYDTKQTPFQVAKERGLAGVAGGFVDQLTGGMTDFDKRGDSKKQKDAKNFLNKFVYGSQGDMARQTRDQTGGGNITSFNPGARPELGEFGFTYNN